MNETLSVLEQAIIDAEQLKREFVKQHPNGAGDKGERNRIYNQVEAARRALRSYKLSHPQLLSHS